MTTRHALNGLTGFVLCGEPVVTVTGPKESVNCPNCRTALNFIRDRYPERFDYTDMRMTASEQREAARDFARDAHA